MFHDTTGLMPARRFDDDEMREVASSIYTLFVKSEDPDCAAGARKAEAGQVEARQDTLMHFSERYAGIREKQD